VDAPEVGVHVSGDGRRVILEPLAEGVRRPRETAHRHPHRQILALDVAGRDEFRIGRARHYFQLAVDAPGGAVPRLATRLRSVQLLGDGVIDVHSEGDVNSFQIRSVAVRPELDAPAQA
jgi:hypothetical protein